ncbi:homocysteine S-methyltransferase [Microlunatus flavus]|uniref:Homocysteine S-methyltransferase n=1 Tax=Microlunatus flavus TaxID=1036181 RepID=A0A1H9B4J6_9ACTN|nr:homocysteine S-methyltransferase [Microlunatus flavus]SEP83854.1 homocysteine S-methyltransferase [Microlunatus flavus]
MARTITEAVTEGPVVLDGGLATQLEAQGRDLSSSVWSAQVLADDPDAVLAAHRAFFAAGAQVATTASYQVSSRGFASVGQDSLHISRLLRRSVRVARQAAHEVDGDAWVAASVGPYGAALGDGSEYRGDYGLSVTQLRRWHKFGIQVLADVGPDVLALETVPCLAEAEALLAEVRGLPTPCWLSMTCDGDRTRAGEPVAEAFAMAAEVDEVIAVGVNCLDPADTPALVALAHATSGKPVVVYPNAGERWDADARRWTGDRTAVAGLVPGWIEAGARLVGGCCRVGPDEISAVADAVGRLRAPTPV